MEQKALECPVCRATKLLNLGLDDNDLSKKPFIGVCHTGNEATPCNILLPTLAC